MDFNLTTFVFETVNFVVLVFILQRLVYRPLQRAIRRRHEAMDEREERARRAMTEAKALQDEVTTRARGLDTLREQVLREATEQAAEERARILRSAHEDAATERARVQRLLEAEREAAVGWVREMAIEHSTEVAGRLLAQIAPEALDETLTRELLGELRGMDLGETAGLREVDVTFAKRPSESTVEGIRRELGRILGAPPRLTQREDESLGAGLVLRLGGKVLDASLSGQLEAFRGRVRTLIEPEVSLG
jgi:F-type H+-transporting ATPase subunit b